MTCWIDAPENNFRYLVREGSKIRVAGWAFVDAQAADRVSVELDDEIVAEHEPAAPRPDVAAVHTLVSNATDRLGFEIEVSLPRLVPGVHRLRVLAQRAGSQPQYSATVEFTAVAPDSLANVSERFVFVPDGLVQKVNGSGSLELFENIGHLTVKSIRHYVTRDPLNDVLDFGCGLGRVLIPFKDQCPGARFTAFDIDPDMLSWARFLIGDRAQRYTLGTEELADESFDLVYAISVFTHLDTTTDFWLSEVGRLLRPGGQVFMTYHDETLFAEHAGTPFLPGTKPGQSLDRYFVTGQGTSEGGAAMGTYYSSEHWIQRVSQFLEVEATVPRGLLDYQSITIARKSAGSGE